MPVFFPLLLQMAVGGAALMLAVPQKPQLQSFFRFASGLFTFLTGLAVLSSPMLYQRQTWHTSVILDSKGWEFIFTLIFGVGLVIYRRRLRRLESGSLPGLLSAVVGIGILAILAGAFGYVAQDGWGLRAAIMPLSFLLSSASLGTVFTGMLFGHWYLNVPGLEVAPYQRIVFALVVCLAMQAALDLLGHLGWIPLAGTPGRFGGQPVLVYLFWGRWLIGLLGSLVIASMAWWVLRSAATQAATGLLYVGVLLVLAGQLIGNFLLLVTRVV